MYKIIGADQKQYGPISADLLRQWIREGRLSPQNLAQAEGASEWKPLSLFPEFAESFHTRNHPPPGVPGAGPVVPPDLERWKAQVLAHPPVLHIGQCLARSWNLMLRQPGLIWGSCVLIWLIESIWMRLPVVHYILFVFHGVLYGGLYFVFIQCFRGQPASITDVFAGLRSNFAQLILVGVLTTILGAIGFMFCVLPGIYLFVAWTFAVPLAIDKRLDFWPAMELSRRVATRVWFELFGLLIVVFIPFILVAGFYGIKTTVTVFSAVWEMMQSGRPDPAEIQAVAARAGVDYSVWIILRVVLLLNLPFATGAIIAAYEDLFGSRPATTT